MPKGRKIVTVERQGGYAARCEVERDGELKICDITFGGFATRTEARAALVHEEAPGAAGTAAEGQTHQGANHMTTISDGAERWEVTHEDGYDEVHLTDPDFPFLHAFASRNEGETFWRVETSMGTQENLHSITATRDMHVAAARLAMRAGRCALELNGELADERAGV